MRRLLVMLIRVLAVGGLVLFGGCGITSLQFKDFVASTAVQAFSQTVTSILQAAIIGSQKLSELRRHAIIT